MNNIPVMSLVYLGAAILLEVIGTLSMKASQGFTRTGPTTVMVTCYIFCFFLLGLVVKKLDIGMVYAIWSGVGTALITIGGIIIFRDSFTVAKGISILLIILGVIGLNLSGSPH